MQAARPVAPLRSAFRFFLPIQTRWADNDQYGHVNNVVSYSYFDTIVNKWLIDCCGLGTPDGVAASGLIGYVVHSQCSYFAQIQYPQLITAGLAVSEIGASSVTYSVALFPPDPASAAASAGTFRHAYVHAASKQPCRPLPPSFREQLQTLLVPSAKL